ncbi:MAG: hypothetical protein AAF628_08450 [Planctomycetota bacterium]
MSKRKVRARPVHFEHGVDSNMQTTISAWDHYVEGRRQQLILELRGMSPGMVAYLAQHCIEALRTIERRVQENIESAVNAGSDR